MTGPSQAGFKSKLSHFLNQTLNPVRGIKRQALRDSVTKKRRRRVMALGRRRIWKKRKRKYEGGDAGREEDGLKQIRVFFFLNYTGRGRDPWEKKNKTCAPPRPHTSRLKSNPYPRIKH
jgi:hypothetical protein